MDKLLEIKGLSYSIRGQRILNNIDLTLHKGEVLGIIGESGSGKSSLGRILMGLTPATSGEIIFKREYRRGLHLSLVPQNTQNAFNPSMKMGRQIIDGALLHRALPQSEALKKAAALIDVLGLPGELPDLYPHELSGGMKQRAALISALITSPEIVILDEVTSGLDVENKKRVLSLLDEMKDKMGILLISHDIEVIRNFSDRVIILNRGTILEWGDTREVMTTPLHPYVKTLVSSEVDKLREEISPVTRIRSEAPDSPCPFTPYCRHAMNICIRRDTYRWQEGRRGTACWLYYKQEER